MFDKALYNRFMTPDKTIFSVSQLNRKAKQLLETHLPLLWVSGEVSNLAIPTSGHWYFTLKDDQAQIRCAMFRTANLRLKWKPESGDQVLLRARVSLYEGRGEYQLIAEHMEAAGTGLLQQQYEALKEKLAAEGLFDSEHKKTLPSFPKHIGVITSPTGAAIHDILSVLKRRYPIAQVTIFPVSVQGENAASDMISALKKVAQFNLCDVLIIGRGGGSIEDLWAFNNELLARAIAACSTPIVSAIGHEVDFTIADFVADQRAPTPSVSAEMITPDIAEWIQTFDSYQDVLLRFCRNKIKQKSDQLHFLQKRLRHPGECIKSQKIRVNYLKLTLIQQMKEQLRLHENRLKQPRQRFLQQHPKVKLKEYATRINYLHQQLNSGINTSILHKRQRFLHHIDILNAMSPLNVLARGYSITRQKNGAIIKTLKDVNLGDELTTVVAKGNISSVVKHISPHTQK
jgi:exodeoxyribonuclease VII large subunit